MRILLVATLLFFGAAARSQEDVDLPKLYNASVDALGAHGAEFSVAFTKGDRQGLIILSPCEDSTDVVIDRSLRGKHLVMMDVEVLSEDLERSVYLRRITFRVSDKTNAETVQKFINEFNRSKSCGSV
ncbi:MAG: hypothetical protein KGI60_02165 [Patescibacteria group bacterium]|nr:hypothetical protein [Patescibacteria group bacterium]